jgi:hypothetical protein
MPEITVNDEEESIESSDHQSQDAYFKAHQIRLRNIKLFRRDFPELKNLSNSQIVLIFKMYKQNCNRQFFASNISFLMAGTLIILITSLFMNAGSSMRISDNNNYPNVIVMNTIISAASSGLLIGLMNQMTNVYVDEQKVHER